MTDEHPEITGAPADAGVPQEKMRSFKAKLEAVLSSDGLKIFLLLFVIYMVTVKTIAVSDTQPLNWAPWVLIRKASLSMHTLHVAPGSYLFYPHHGGYYSMFGIGTPLLAVPIYLIPSLVIGHMTDTWAMFLGKTSAAFLAAGSAVFIYYVAKRYSDRVTAVAVALIFGLATNMFAMASQLLLQLTGAIFCIAAGLFFLSFEDRRPWHLVMAGVAFAWAGMSQPSLFLVATLFGLYVLVKRGKGVLLYAAGAVPIFILTLIYQWVSYGSPFKTGETLATVFLKTGSWNGHLSFGKYWSTPLLKGLGGVLISPSRGLLAWSPILLLALLGIVLNVWKKGPSLLNYAAVSALVIVLISAKWFDWAGSNGYGYRNTLAVVPLLCILMVPAVKFIKGKKALLAVVAVLVAFSLFVQVVGYLSYDGASWEWTFDKKGEAKYWSVSQAQWLWETENFQFFLSPFWQNAIRDPIDVSHVGVKLKKSGKGLYTAEVRLTVSQLCLAGVNLEQPWKRVAFDYSMVPKGRNVLPLKGSFDPEKETFMSLIIRDESDQYQRFRERYRLVTSGGRVLRLELAPSHMPGL